MSIRPEPLRFNLTFWRIIAALAGAAMIYFGLDTILGGSHFIDPSGERRYMRMFVIFENSLGNQFGSWVVGIFWLAIGAITISHVFGDLISGLKSRLRKGGFKA